MTSSLWLPMIGRFILFDNEPHCNFHPMYLFLYIEHLHYLFIFLLFDDINYLFVGILSNISSLIQYIFTYTYPTYIFAFIQNTCASLAELFIQYTPMPPSTTIAYVPMSTDMRWRLSAGQFQLQSN